MGPGFLPTLRKFCTLLYCQASHTEVSRRNSTELCQTVQSKSRYQAVVKWGRSCRKNLGPKLCKFRFVDDQDLMANIFRKKHAIDNQNGVGNCTGSSMLSPNFITLVHKCRKMGPSYLPTVRKWCMLLLCPPSQNEVTEQSSTKLCEILGSESEFQTHV